jgi:menaquinone-dependent protoporphyrinogen oxidase
LIFASKFIEGDENMVNEKILVTYASQAGSTASVAEAIGQTLVEKGLQVDVRGMKDVTDLTPYRAVVAGSAIHGGKWLPEAMRFVRANRTELSKKPFAAFIVCITMGSPNAAKYRAGLSKWLEPVSTLVTPRSEGIFAGSLDFKTLPITFNTLLMRVAVLLGALPSEDHRDWAAVRAWAASLPKALS